MFKPTKQPASNLTDTYLITARLTRPSEPILFPKLRIQFADFPYLHCSIARGCSPWRPDADMGTACHENYNASLGFSRADKSVPDTTREGGALRRLAPYLRTTRFQGVCAPNKEKRTLPRTLADVSEVVYVTVPTQTDRSRNVSISVGRVGNINPIPFRYRGLLFATVQSSSNTEHCGAMSGTPSLYRVTGSLRTA